MKCHFLLTEKFRQGPLYKLVEWNLLSQYQRVLLSGLHDEAEIYGVFEPVSISAELTFKVAYREVVMLYMHLQHFDKLPHYFIVSGTQNSNEVLARLLLDNIIEIEWAGNYVSGPLALPAIYGEAIFEEDKIPDHLSELSLKAIYYVWMLNETDLRSVSNRLYTFNTIPWDVSEKVAFKNKHTVKGFLFSKTDTSFTEAMEKQWKAFPDHDTNYWLSWDRSFTAKKIQRNSKYTYKLYISPLVNDLPEVFKRFIPVISASDAFHFKAGATIEGILRPDKLVAYFYTFEALMQTTAILQQELSDFHAHGVPFSAQSDANGLLSHGADPPSTDVLHSIEGGSWRTKIADQLALAILQAKKQQLNWQQTISFIRAVLLTAGIDSNHWMESRSVNNIH